jgi:hypothetical protein
MQGRWHRLRWLSTTGLYLVLLAAGSARPATAATAPAPAATPDLSGTWTLNEELSQDPRTALREAQGKEHQGGGGGRRGGGRRGGGFPAGGGGGNAGGDSSDTGNARRSPDGAGTEDEGHAGNDFGLEAKELHLKAEGTQLTLAEADGTIRQVLHTDGRKMSEEKPGVGTVKTQAQWKDGALEVVTQLPKGRTKTEIYEMTHDRKRLYVLVTLEGFGKMPTVTFRRVYDPEPAPAAAPAPGAPGASLPSDDDIV